MTKFHIFEIITPPRQPPWHPSSKAKLNHSVCWIQGRINEYVASEQQACLHAYKIFRPWMAKDECLYGFPCGQTIQNFTLENVCVYCENDKLHTLNPTPNLVWQYLIEPWEKNDTLNDKTLPLDPWCYSHEYTPAQAIINTLGKPVAVGIVKNRETLHFLRTDISQIYIDSKMLENEERLKLAKWAANEVQKCTLPLHQIKPFKQTINLRHVAISLFS